MFDRKIRLRAIVRTALTWGLAWAVAGGAIVAGITLFSSDPGIESLIERVGVAAISGIAWGVRFGIAGTVIGGAFASLVRLGFMGRRLSEIKVGRFALLGAIVGGVGVPLYLQLMNVLSGTGPIAWGLVTDDAVWASVFGAAAAAGSIVLARRAEATSRESDEIENVNDVRALPEAEERPTPIQTRSESRQSR